VTGVWQRRSVMILCFCRTQAPLVFYTRSLHDALPISPQEEWYGHVGLEAAAHLREQSAQSIQSLQRDMQTAMSALAALQEFSERSEEHTSELQSRENLVCRLLLEKKQRKNRVDRYSNA